MIWVKELNQFRAAPEGLPVECHNYLDRIYTLLYSIIRTALEGRFLIALYSTVWVLS